MSGVAAGSSNDVYKSAEFKHVIGSNRWYPGDEEKKVKEVSIPGKRRSDEEVLMASGQKESGNEIATVEHIEKIEPEPAKQGFVKRTWTRWWKHYKRWWCCYLLGSIIFLAILLPVFFLVAFPAIAQLMVNKTALPIYEGAIVNPTPNSVTFSILSSLNIPKPFSISLNPVTLYLYNNDTVPRVSYSAVTLPGQKLKGNSTISVDRQTAVIDNPDEFKKFLQNAFSNKRVALSVFGNTTAKVGALKTHVNLNKVVEIDGLDNLSGFGIESAQVVLPPRADGTNLIGNLTIPNHSKITLGLGNVTLNMLSGNLKIGQATIFNVVAKPGNNTFPCTGQIYLATLIQNIPEILQAQSNALRQGNIEISASGNSTVYNGQHIEYLEYVLNSIKLTTQVPILKLLADSLGGLLQGSGSSLFGNLTSILNSTSGGLGGLGGLSGLLNGLNITAVEEEYRRIVLLR